MATATCQYRTSIGSRKHHEEVSCCRFPKNANKWEKTKGKGTELKSNICILKMYTKILINPDSLDTTLYLCTL